MHLKYGLCTTLKKKKDSKKTHIISVYMSDLLHSNASYVVDVHVQVS